VVVGLVQLGWWRREGCGEGGQDRRGGEGGGWRAEGARWRGAPLRRRMRRRRRRRKV
jgi:hypothetical protein